MLLLSIKTLVTCFLLLATHNISARVEPPNFLLIFLDDVGYGDIGVNDKNVFETPHIDALAASGMLFRDMHTGFSVCTPSRADLMTGRLAPRTGVFGNFAPDSSHGMALEEITIADILSNDDKQDKGAVMYVNHMIGKW